MDVEERISEALKRIAPHPHPGDPFPQVRARQHRRRLVRRMETVGLSLVVLVGVVLGGYWLLRAFRGQEPLRPGSPPVGETLAFASERDGSFDIFLAASDGSQVTRITDAASNEFDPAWSPDGAKLVFVSDRDGNEEIYLVDADGTGIRRLTNSPSLDRSPTWSPDGKWIAFSSDRSGTDDIYLMAPDGSGVRAITQGPETDWHPAWSPDGQLLVFARTENGVTEGPAAPGFQLHLLDVESGSVQKLTSSPGDALRPAWAPDGRTVVFERNQQLHLVSVGGGEERQLALDSALPANDPTWSAAGLIAFMSDGEHGADVFVVPASGGRAIRITESPGEDTQPVWAPAGSGLSSKTDGGTLDVTFPDGSTAEITIPAGQDLRSFPLQPDVSIILKGKFYAPIVFARGGPHRPILAGEGPIDQLPSGETVWAAKRNNSSQSLSVVTRWVVFSLPEWTVHVPLPPEVSPAELVASVQPQQSADGLVVVRVQAPVHLAESFGEGGGPQVAIGDGNPLPSTVDAGPEFRVIELAPDKCTGGRRLETDIGGPDELYASLCLAEGQVFASVYGDAEFVRDVYEDLDVVSFSSAQ